MLEQNWVGAWLVARGGARLQLQYTKIELGSNFQKNLNSRDVKCDWGLDGCARWRKVTVTVAIQLSWGMIFKRI